MATHQNTFSVISNGGPRAGAPSKPPMTSKQAQKLYKQKNKEPRRSKAEQRKWEKERQEEIKKELERERAAVKAKQARERKKAKEEEARENRRRQGQPLVDCRPSQDTIARFVRGNGTHRKRDSSGEPIPEKHTSESPETEASPRSPKKNLVVSPQQLAPPNPDTSAASMPPPPRPSQRPRPATSVPRASQFKTTSVPKAASAAPPQRAPSVFKPSASVPTHGRTNAPVTMPKPAPKPKPKPFMMPKGIVPVQMPAHQKPVKQEKVNVPPGGETRPIKETVETTSGDRQAKAPKLEQKPAIGEKTAADKKPSIEKKVLVKQEPPLGPKSSNTTQVQHGRAKPMFDPSQMPPPPKPPPRTVTPQRYPPKMPPLPPRTEMPPPKAPSPQKQSPSIPPPSTQAIIQDCFDDFFPTASQLAIELEDDNPTDVPDESQGPADVTDQEKGGRVEEHHKRLILEASAANNHPRPQQRAVNERSNGLNTPAQTTFLQTKEQQPHTSRPRDQPFPSTIDRTSAQGATPTLSTPNKALSVTGTWKKPSQPRNLPQQVTPVAQKPRSILREINSNHIPKRRAPAPATPLYDDFFPPICTQDLMMSSQEVLEIESPAKFDGALSSAESSAGREYQPSPLIEMDLAAIDWDDDLDDF